MSFRLEVEGDWDELRDETAYALSTVVQATAHQIEGLAKTRCPVDTGYLRNSIQTRSTGALVAEVTVGARYGLYVEMGTVRSRAQPYLAPAVDAARPGFQAAVRAVIRRRGR